METQSAVESGASARAIGSLVLGVIGLLPGGTLCCFAPVLAIALGWGEAGSLASAGRILGWIGLIKDFLVAVIAVIVVSLFFFD